MARRSGAAQGGGGGLVDTVNGVAPINGDVTLTGDDIPYTPAFATFATTLNPSTTLGAQVRWSETNFGTTSYIWGEPTLENGFPVSATVHTIDRPSVWMSPLGGAPIVLPPGDSIGYVHPGSALALGSVKVAVIGNVAGPLVFGEPVLEGFTIFNTSGDPAAVDLQAESLFGRFVVLTDVTLLGQGGAIIEDIFGVTSWRGGALAPAAPGASGISIDGTNGTVLLINIVAQAPAGGGYAGVTLEDTASVANQLIVSASTVISQDLTDYLVSLSSLASVPTGPLPTSIVGIRVESTTTTGPGSLFDPAGLTADDIEVSSFGHLNGPRSNFIGDAIFNSAGTPPDALLDHVGQANVPLIVPYSNASNGGVGGTLRVLTPAGSESRHTLMLGTVDAATVNAGGTYTGGDGNYPATQAATSGVGTGAEFTVTLTAGAITAVVSVDKLGTGYEAADTITLLVVGPAETAAAVLDVDGVAWALQTDGPVGDLAGAVQWTVDHQRGVGGAGSVVFGFLARRVGGAGVWVEVPGTPSLPQALTPTPTEAAGGALLKDVGVGDQWTIFWVNDNGNSTQTLFTIIEPSVVVQP